MGVENIKVEAMDVFFGENVTQVEKITIRSGIAKASLAGAYFHIYAMVTGVVQKHVFWFKTTNSDSAPTGVDDSTKHQVDISSNAIDTTAEIASALQVAIDATAILNAGVSNNVVTVEQLEVGYVPSAHDAKNPGKVTNFGFEIVEQGDTEDNLGCIEGEIAVSFEESFLDVQCHAEGVTPVAQIKNGVSKVEVTLNLEETNEEKLKKMFVKTGGSYVPDNGTEIYGMGTFKNFENMFKYATKLRLHPIRLLSGDLSEDFTFHKALPNLKGLTFSGTKVLTLPVTFKVYPADGVDSRINYFSIGDASQSIA